MANDAHRQGGRLSEPAQRPIVLNRSVVGVGISLPRRPPGRELGRAPARLFGRDALPGGAAREPRAPGDREALGEPDHLHRHRIGVEPAAGRHVDRAELQHGRRPRSRRPDARARRVHHGPPRRERGVRAAHLAQHALEVERARARRMEPGRAEHHGSCQDAPVAALHLDRSSRHRGGTPPAGLVTRGLPARAPSAIAPRGGEAAGGTSAQTLPVDAGRFTSAGSGERRSARGGGSACRRGGRIGARSRRAPPRGGNDRGGSGRGGEDRLQKWLAARAALDRRRGAGKRARHAARKELGARVVPVLPLREWSAGAAPGARVGGRRRLGVTGGDARRRGSRHRGRDQAVVAPDQERRQGDDRSQSRSAAKVHRSAHGVGSERCSLYTIGHSCL